MKIYTKTGDAGETGLFGGGRVGKDDLRVASYGEVDELNAVLGLASAHGLPPELAERVARVQAELFTLGSVLATPAGGKVKIPSLHPEWVTTLEMEIDAADVELPPLKNFILPGGSTGAAWLHLARATCRRAERAIVALSRREKLEPIVEVYVNRLSDWLFTMARLANHRAGVAEPVWKQR
jgi:cob(I)alamin adenosyltransferase